MNASPISQVIIRGLHGVTDLDVNLRPGLSVLHGRNGTGKTTFLHIVANLAEGDLERFFFLRFTSITVRTVAGFQATILRSDEPSSGTRVSLQIDGELVCTLSQDEQTPDGVRQRLSELFGGRPTYLPAFRAVLEAISNNRTEQYLTERRTAEARRIRELELDPALGGGHDHISEFQRLSPYNRNRGETIAHKTILCREWFGSFVPVVRFPSLGEVSHELSAEYDGAQLALAHRDRQAFSDLFVSVLRTIISPPQQAQPNTGTLLSSIRKHLESLQDATPDVPGVYAQIASILRADADDSPFSDSAGSTGTADREAMAANILQLYDEALLDRVRAQRDGLRRVSVFETSVNRFLQDKSLHLIPTPSARHSRNRVRVIMGHGRDMPLSTLSSGERHVLTLLFSATHMSAAKGLLLIDEPELSLHVDWQRLILGELIRQAGDRQIIACTHAPEVVADHRFSMVELSPQPHNTAQTEVFGDRLPLEPT